MEEMKHFNRYQNFIYSDHVIQVCFPFELAFKSKYCIDNVELILNIDILY